MHKDFLAVPLGVSLPFSWITLEEIKLLGDKGIFTLVALGFDRRQAQLDRELSQLGLQGVWEK